MFKHERSKTIAPARYSENKIPKQKPLPQNQLLGLKINIGISMSDSEEMTKDPGYDAEASGASKATIFTFIGTFVACLFLFENTAGLISGAIFVFVGMFVASLLISAPLFLLKKKYTGPSILFGLLDVVITIFATVMVFSYFFTNPMDFATAAAPGDDSKPYVLRCNEAIPEFTLARMTEKFVRATPGNAAISSKSWLSFPVDSAATMSYSPLTVKSAVTAGISSRASNAQPVSCCSIIRSTCHSIVIRG